MNPVVYGLKGSPRAPCCSLNAERPATLRGAHQLPRTALTGARVGGLQAPERGRLHRCGGHAQACALVGGVSLWVGLRVPFQWWWWAVVDMLYTGVYGVFECTTTMVARRLVVFE